MPRCLRFGGLCPSQAPRKEVLGEIRGPLEAPRGENECPIFLARGKGGCKYQPKLNQTNENERGV